MTSMWRYNADVRDFVSDYDDFKHECNIHGRDYLVNFAGLKTAQDCWIDAPENPRKYMSHTELDAFAKKQAHLDQDFDYEMFRRYILNKLQNGRIHMRRVAASQWGIPLQSR